jgi:hypothetical protein
MKAIPGIYGADFCSKIDAGAATALVTGVTALIDLSFDALAARRGAEWRPREFEFHEAFVHDAARGTTLIDGFAVV